MEPTILHFGTPVALLSTVDPDGTPDLAPVASAWWLGWTCMLGLGQMRQATANLIRTRECVINLPSASLVSQVDRLARSTKFDEAGLTPVASERVGPPRVEECLVQMEGIVHEWRRFGDSGNGYAVEVHVVKLHVREGLLVGCGGRFFNLGGDGYVSRLADSKFMTMMAGGRAA